MCVLYSSLLFSNHHLTFPKLILQSLTLIKPLISYYLGIIAPLSINRFPNLSQNFLHYKSSNFSPYSLFYNLNLFLNLWFNYFNIFTNRIFYLLPVNFNSFPMYIDSKVLILFLPRSYYILAIVYIVYSV